MRNHKNQDDGKNPQRHVVLLFEVLAEEQLLIISKQVVEGDLMDNFDDKNTTSTIHLIVYNVYTATLLILLNCFTLLKQ